MLIYGLYHPRFHNASRMWSMNINIGTRQDILKPNTRTGSGTFGMNVFAAKVLILVLNAKQS